MNDWSFVSAQLYCCCNDGLYLRNADGYSQIADVPIAMENEHSHHPTNCKNCGAPLHGHICEFCDTEYT